MAVGAARASAPGEFDVSVEVGGGKGHVLAARAALAAEGEEVAADRLVGDGDAVLAREHAAMARVLLNALQVRCLTVRV